MFANTVEQQQEQVMSTYKNEPKPTEEPKEGYKWVQNLMSGKWVQEPIDTPWTCSVQSESYWSS